MFYGEKSNATSSKSKGRPRRGSLHSPNDDKRTARNPKEGHPTRDSARLQALSFGLRFKTHRRGRRTLSNIAFLNTTSGRCRRTSLPDRLIAKHGMQYISRIAWSASGSLLVRVRTSSAVNFWTDVKLMVGIFIFTFILYHEGSANCAYVPQLVFSANPQPVSRIRILSCLDSKKSLDL